MRCVLEGKLPEIPAEYKPIVDIRDVAQAHLAAMKCEDAANRRIIINSKLMWLKDYLKPV